VLRNFLLYGSYVQEITLRLQARKHCLTPSSLQGQLLWRDFFYTVAACTPNFTVMRDNPICLQIEWTSNDEHLKRWKEVRDFQTAYNKSYQVVAILMRLR